MAFDPRGDRRGGMDGARRHAVDLAERAIAMQMGVDGDDAVEGRGKQRGEGSRRHRFTGVEALVLPQIGKIGSRQQDPRGTEIPGSVGGEQQRKRLLVGPAEAGHHDDVPASDVGVQPDQRLAVRKAMQNQRRGLGSKRTRHLRRERVIVGQMEDEGRHWISCSSRKIGGRDWMKPRA
jgi:hypothetical protein